MKIGIFQDIHANLPAFKKGVEVFKQYGCTKIYHVGDLIGIGPHPKEVMDLAFSVTDMEFIMGNHDYWYAFGLPETLPAYMNEEEVSHHLWAHKQIGEAYRSRVQNWKFYQDFGAGNGKKIRFQHYGLNKQRNWFKPHIKYPVGEELDHMFDGDQVDMIFYGHNHLESDILGKNRYINLGSAGCFDKPEVRLGILEIKDGALTLEKHSVVYDDDGLMEDFEKREVPAREFITKAFITRQ